MAQALQQMVNERQLALYGTPETAGRYDGGRYDGGRYDGGRCDGGVARRRRTRRAMCAGCRAREARYGFSDERESDSLDSRPRALCFECFRTELDRRYAVKARLARSWNARQVQLPLEQRLKELTRRRRRAQIAARHALGV